jgi:hypothetical protein
MTFARMALFAVLLAGCDHVLDLRVEAQMLCVPAASQTFSGGSTKLGPLTLPGTTTKTVTVDFSKALAQVPGEQAGLKLDVRLDQVSIKSMTDLVFVKHVKVSLAPGTPSDALPPLYVGEYVRGGTTMSPVPEVKVPSVLDSNVIKYLKDEPAKLMFTATGTPPADSFTADVEACVFVQGQGTF